MKLGHRLYLGFAIPTICLVGLGMYSLLAFDNIDRQVGTIYDDRVIPLQQLKLISDSYAISIADAVNKAHAGQLTMNQAFQSVDEALLKIEKNWQEYLKTHLTPEEEKLVAEVQSLFVPANRKINELKQVLQTSTSAELEAFDVKLYQVIDPLSNKIHQLSDLQLRVAQHEREKAAAVYQQTRAIFIPLLLVSLLIGSPVGFWLIQKAIAAVLKDIVNTIATSASEIAANTEQQERITQQQASAVQQTTTTMDELKASSHQASIQAEAAVKEAMQVLSLADEGNGGMEQAGREMKSLEEKMEMMRSQIEHLRKISSQIGKITTLVSDFALQTNMLALNAAVESVRAGDQGKGFGVVAAEIRKLADQSQSSASQINALVTQIHEAIATTVVASSESTQSVHQGAKIASQTSQIFSRVCDAIHQIVQNSQEIFLGVQQQANAIQQVRDTMQNLNTAAQETAGGISQTKIGTRQLNEKALELKEIV